MKKLAAVMVLSLSMAAGAMAADTFRFNPYGEAYYGWNSNIFKSPDLITTGTGDINPVVSDSFIDSSIGLKLMYKPTNEDRFRLEYNSDFLNYLYRSVNNNYDHTILLSYDRKLGDASLKIKADADKALKTETDAVGVELTRLYSYYKAMAGVEAGYEFTEGISAAAGYAFRKKDYDEAAGLTSLDYLQHEIKLESSNQILKGELSAVLEADLRGYGEYPASDASGNTSAAYPKRQYNYYIGKLGYDFWFDGRKKGSKVGLEYTGQVRDDAFEDYYTYTENGVDFRILAQATDALEIKAAAGFKFRNYQVYRASVPGPNPLMMKNYYSASVEAKYVFNEHVELSGGYEFDWRDTNTENNWYVSGRDYMVHELRAGFKAQY